MRSSSIICLLASLAATEAFTVSTPSRTTTALNAVSRDNFLKQVAGVAGAAAFSGIANPLAAFAEGEEVKLPSGTSYVVVKNGDGPAPKVGELAGIRFKAKVVQTGNKIDDIFDTPEPYYTRVGSGGLLKVISIAFMAEFSFFVSFLYYFLCINRELRKFFLQCV